LLADRNDEKTNKRLLSKVHRPTRDLIREDEVARPSSVFAWLTRSRAYEQLDEIEEMTSRQSRVLEKDHRREKSGKLVRATKLPPVGNQRVKSTSPCSAAVGGDQDGRPPR